MIKNERQYRITKAQAARFAKALTNASADHGPNPSLHPLLMKAQQDALASQLEELREEIRDYERLRSGTRKTIKLTSFDELPRALIQSRIALGLSQKNLADRIGIKEQQLQRYEATDYSSASVERIKEIIAALGIKIREQIFLPASAKPPTR